MMLNAKNARPFGKPRRPRPRPDLPDGWELGQCLIAGAGMGDDTYDAWEVTTPSGKRDVVFTKRNGK